MLETSITQGSVALSSAESELAAAVRGVTEGLFLQNLLRFFDHEISLRLGTDSSAALGVTQRLGAGKRLRHVQTHMFFIQHLVKEKKLVVVKEDGKSNVADIGTKHLPFAAMNKILAKLGMKLLLAGNMISTSEAGQVSNLVRDGYDFVQNQGITRTVAFMIDVTDVELIGVGVLLCLVMIYLMKKVVQDMGYFLQRVRNVLTPPQNNDDTAEPVPRNIYYTKGSLAKNVEDRRAHYYEDCERFTASSVVQSCTMCVTCLNKKKEELGGQ